MARQRRTSLSIIDVEGDKKTASIDVEGDKKMEENKS
jgi:hypothetical protein